MHKYVIMLRFSVVRVTSLRSRSSPQTGRKRKCLLVKVSCERSAATPAISYARRPAARLVDQGTPDPESHSPPAEAAVPLLKHPAFSATGKGAARLDSNYRGRLIQHSLHKVNEITLRPISTRVSFLAATIHTAGDTNAAVVLQ
jgi:hypothetical protein